MSLRISTAYPQQYNTTNMLNLQTQLNTTQLKISSGKQNLTAADNPAAAVSALSFQQAIDTGNQHQTNIASANQRLSLEDTTLTSIISTIQNLQSLGLQGVSAPDASTSGNAIADAFDQANQELLGLANTVNSNGEYLFSGTKSNVMPFSEQNPSAATASTTTPVIASTIDNVPASDWTTYLSKQATTDALNYIVTNPNATLSDALAWATNQASTVSTMGQAASASITAPPASLQTALADASPYMAAFQTAFTSAGAQGTTASAVAHIAVVPLASASVDSSAAYDVYIKSLANYVPPAATTDTTNPVATPNSGVTPSSTAGFIYFGSNTQRSVQIGSSRTINDGDTGTAVFGDTATGQSLFDTIKTFSAQLRAGTPTLATLKQLDTALTQVSNVQSDVGARMNALTSQQSINQDFIINNQTALSQVQDLDYAGAVTQLNSQQLSLQAAQQSYAKVQGMSLFKYL